jgi:flagellar biogenesis protein FliO
MRGRRSGLLLLVGALLLLSVCLQLGVGSAASGPAAARPQGASNVAATQPAPPGPAQPGPVPTGPALVGPAPTGQASAGGAKKAPTSAGWKDLTQQTHRFGDSGAPGPLWQMLGMVVVIAILGAVGLWVVKRLVPKMQQRRGRNIAVLETACLGPSRSVHLLRVGQREFLIASTREHISMLADVTGAVGAASGEVAAREVEL